MAQDAEDQKDLAQIIDADDELTRIFAGKERDVETVRGVLATITDISSEAKGRLELALRNLDGNSERIRDVGAMDDGPYEFTAVRLLRLAFHLYEIGGEDVRFKIAYDNTGKPIEDPEEMETYLNDKIAERERMNREKKKGKLPENGSSYESIYLQKIKQAKREIESRGDLEPARKKQLIKEKNAEIRKEISEKHKLLADFIRETLLKIKSVSEQEPDYSIEKIIDQVSSNSEIERKFTPEERERIIQTVRSVCEKNKNIDLYYKTYKDDPGLLFMLEFGAPPVGTVALRKTPFSLVFQLYDIRDFQKGSFTEDISPEYIGGGFGQPHSTLPGIEGTIILIDCSRFDGIKDEIIIHEERHVINGFIETGINFRTEQEIDTIEPLHAQGLSAYDKEVAKKKQIRQIHDCFSDLLSNSLATAKDEIIAYMADGDKAEAIIGRLTEEYGLYDMWSNEYYPEIKKILGSMGPDQLPLEAVQLIIRKSEEFRKLHNKLVREAVIAAFKIGDIDQLAVIPIRQWGK